MIYFSAEHLFWPPALAAAAHIDSMLIEKPTAAEKLLWGSLGGDLPFLSYQMFSSVGVNLAKPEPYQAIFEILKSSDERAN